MLAARQEAIAFDRNAVPGETRQSRVGPSETSGNCCLRRAPWTECDTAAEHGEFKRAGFARAGEPSAARGIGLPRRRAAGGINLERSKSAPNIVSPRMFLPSGKRSVELRSKCPTAVA